MLEVRNLTGLPAAAGAQLGRVVKAELDPVPLAAVLREAALSQSRIRLDAAGCGACLHADRAQCRKRYATSYGTNCTQCRAADAG